MVEVMSVIVGIFSAFLILIFTGALFFILYAIWNAHYKYLVTIRNYNHGKPFMEYYWAKIERNKNMGKILVVPKLKKEGRGIYPYQPEHILSTNRNGKYYVGMAMNGKHVTAESTSELIEKVVPVAEISSEGKMNITEQKLQVPIVRPVSDDMRSFNLQADTEIENQYGAENGWWDKHGGKVLTAGIVLAGATVAIIMVILGYQAYTESLSGDAPAWAERLLARGSPESAPPTAGFIWYGLLIPLWRKVRCHED